MMTSKRSLLLGTIAWLVLIVAVVAIDGIAGGTIR
jgi:hypothetical protein